MEAHLQGLQGKPMCSNLVCKTARYRGTTPLRAPSTCRPTSASSKGACREQWGALRRCGASHREGNPTHSQCGGRGRPSLLLQWLLPPFSCNPGPTPFSFASIPLYSRPRLSLCRPLSLPCLCHHLSPSLSVPPFQPFHVYAAPLL
jgi:hypothetical protein